MSKLSNTIDVAKDAWVFGAVGGGIGFAGGLLSTWASQGDFDKNTFYLAGATSLAGAALFQAGGMMFVNQQQGGRGLIFTTVGVPVGFGFGAAYAALKKQVTSPRAVIKAGAVGSIIAGTAGGVADIVISYMK